MTFDEAIQWMEDANKAHQACAGIDTAHLWPGAMGEMREALKMAEAHIVQLYDAIAPHAKYDNGNRVADADPKVCDLRAILAKVRRAP